VVERFHRPVFVLGIENGMAQGSGRSIPAFHLLEALESMPDLFTKFGGHRQAAGLSMAAELVEMFRERFRAYASQRLSAADFEPELTIDSEIDFGELTDAAVAEVLRLAPFGFGNAPPVFVARDVEITAPPEILKERHLFLRVRSNGRMLRMKGWDFAARAEQLQPGMRVDLAFQVEDDPYSASRGYAPWQAILKDLRASRQLARAG
jgi:single-stranded-DNA-specific exonuclease